MRTLRPGERFVTVLTAGWSPGRSAVGGFQVLKVSEVAGPSGRPLHRLQVGERADPDGGAQNLGLCGPGPQFLEVRDSVQALDHIEAAELGLDRDLLTAGQRRCDGDRTSKQRLALLNVTACGNGHLPDSFEVLGLGCDDDVDVLGAAYDSPRIQSKPTDYDELDVRFGQAAQQLVECRFAQLRSADPVNRISL